MGDMLIRNVPEPLKREIEQAARKIGQSLSGKAIDLLWKGMIAEKEGRPEANFSAWDSIRSAFADESAIDGEFAEMMNTIEAERKRDFGRQPEDFE
ncbi:MULTISPECIES: plasmid stabilization protein [unclassified Mesorhizobium]|uniref:plasmid stabilization protein n=1 Tax=unclassified Mesorhizobium TaxID=325217 RepID=UPI00143F1812|nr:MULTISPECIES: plasmid stabilization protein [unclassified Mesorhizobium]